MGTRKVSDVLHYTLRKRVMQVLTRRTKPIHESSVPCRTEGQPWSRPSAVRSSHADAASPHMLCFGAGRKTSSNCGVLPPNSVFLITRLYLSRVFTSFTVPLVLLFTANLQAQTPLAFASSASGRFQVYTTQPCPVLHNPASSYSCTSSPTQQLTTAGGGNQESRSPDWSTLNRIAYQFGAPGVREIHLVKPDGTGDVNLTTLPGDERDPSWSPDGRFIVYAFQATGATDYDIWIHDTNGTPDNPNDDADYPLGVLLGAHTQELRPTWAPNFSSIAFVTTAPGLSATGPNSKIALVPIALVSGKVQITGPFNILTDDSFTSFDPTWSPNGTYLAFSTTRNGGHDIYRMSTLSEGDTQNLLRLTSTTANNTNPAWSPDGSTLAFVSDRSGTPEIY